MGAVLFAQSAQTDLLEAWLFIAEENLNAADKVIDTIEQEALGNSAANGSCPS